MGKGRLEFRGNLNGSWAVAQRGRRFGVKCGVVGFAERPRAKARKLEPRNWPAWKAGKGLPRLTVFPKGWRSWAVLRGCGFGEMPETRAGKSPGFPEVVKRAELCGVLTGGKGRRDKTGKARSFRKRDIFGMFCTAITCAGNPQEGRQRSTLTTNSKISYAVG